MAIFAEIPSEYGLVIAASVSTFWVNMLHTIETGRLRVATKIAAPAAYATEEQVKSNPAAGRFNCAQRAHANFTENHLSVLGSLLISGLTNPVTAASVGFAWSLGRVMYLYGYVSERKGAKGRYPGYLISIVADYALKLMATYVAYKLLV